MHELNSMSNLEDEPPKHAATPNSHVVPRHRAAQERPHVPRAAGPPVETTKVTGGVSSVAGVNVGEESAPCLERARPCRLSTVPPVRDSSLPVQASLVDLYDELQRLEERRHQPLDGRRLLSKGSTGVLAKGVSRTQSKSKSPKPRRQRSRQPVRRCACRSHCSCQA